MEKSDIVKCLGDSGSQIQTMENGYDCTDKPPNSYHVTKFNLGTLLLSIVVHCVDIGFDIYVAYSYFQTSKYAYGAWSVVLMLLPSIVLALISIRMYLDDLYKDRIKYKGSIVRIVLCIVGIIVQSAPLIRNCDSLYYASKSLKAESQSQKGKQKKYFTKMLNEDSDTAFLRVFEAYLESAPQQVLQMTLLLVDYMKGSYVHSTRQILSIIIGFQSMALSMANYNRCIRFERTDKPNISCSGLVVHFLWHLCFTASRILTISAVASIYAFWTCIAIGIHWGGMFIWLAVSNKTSFCEKRLYEVFFSGAIGAIYIFTFLNLEDRPTKKYYLIFFLLIFVENTIATTIWGLKSSFKNWVYYFFLILPIVFFGLSVVFIIVYYKFLHPNKFKSDMKNNENDYNSVGHDQTFTLSDE